MSTRFAPAYNFKNAYNGIETVNNFKGSSFV